MKPYENPTHPRYRFKYIDGRGAMSAPLYKLAAGRDIRGNSVIKSYDRTEERLSRATINTFLEESNYDTQAIYSGSGRSRVDTIRLRASEW